MEIKYAKFLNGDDLKAIAQFNRIVKNYLKMKKLEEQSKTKQ